MALRSPTANRTALAALVLVGLAGAAVAGGVAADGGQSGANLTVLAANGSVDDRIADAGDVRALRSNGTLTEPGYDDTVVYGDTLVVRIRSEALNESVAAADGATATERFFAALEESRTNLTVRALVGPNRRPYEIALERSETRVVRDRRTATTYAVVDTSDIVVTERDSDERFPSFPDWDDFEVTLERPEGPPLEDNFAFVGPDATVDSPTAGLRTSGRGPARIDAGADEAILSGYTNLLPGRTVEVAAVGSNGTVLADDTVTTTANASAAADPERSRSEFDAWLTGLSTADRERFTLRVTNGNRTVWERRVVVGPEPRWSDLAATAVESGADSWTLRVNASIRVPDGALFVVDLRSGGEYYSREAVVPEGRSEQTVAFEGLDGSPGGSVDLELLWDADGDGEYGRPPDTEFTTTADVPKTEYGELSVEFGVDGAGVTTVTPTPTPTATAEPTATGTATARPTATQTATPAATAPPEPPTTPKTATRTGAGTKAGTSTATPTTADTTGTATAGRTATAATSGDGPGFGVAAASVALLAGLFAATRRG
ncbi:PGF-CTERM sorting domain-containing protein [Halosimplex halophilum]|uniref:PGF-CTERM sorting domain-containing protein n=1 Tax=Halosimplex halophilum TaxID=2559572 RepID=UPI00107F4BAC|nr:PGF-CTERM sorting domain-containing protein [Halosimplex halophilum]